MIKGNRLRNISLVVILLAFTAFLVSGNLFSAVSFSDKEVYLPQYLSGECVPRLNNMQELNKGTFDNDGEYFGCVSSDSNTWIPVGSQCSFTVEGTWAFKAFICDNDNQDTSSCDKLQSIVSPFNNQKTFSVGQGEYLYLATGVSKDTLYAKYPAYGLSVETADGRVLETTLSCELNSLSGRDIHTIDAPNIVVPDSPFNAVTGLSKAISTQVTSVSGVQGGDSIYVTKPGFYFLIKTSDDGFRYVDTSAGERSSSLIECIPLSTGCTIDAKINDDLEEQECSIFGGSIVGYAPVSGDSTKLCKYECVNGFNQVTSDCITVLACTDPDFPNWNPQTGECDAVVVEPDVVNNDNLFWLVIIGLVFLLLLVLIIVAFQKKGKGGKKK